jgi:hypothetical protein
VGEDTFVYFEDIVYRLALLSLPLFCFQLLFPDALIQVNDFLYNFIPARDIGDVNAHYSNSILFTINPWALNRNSGFMWEPGAFAVMLLIALTFNLIFNRFTLNAKFHVLLIALLTTLSTSGYILLVVMAMFLLSNIRTRNKVVLVPLFVSGFLYMSTLSFVTDEVMYRFQKSTKFEENAFYYAQTNSQISAGRFAGFIFDLQTFQEHPVIGVGKQYEERVQNRWLDFMSANSLSNYLATFGTLGMLFLLYNLYQTFRFIRTKYPFKGLYLIIILLLGLYFSSPVLFTPLFLGMQFFYFLEKKPQPYALMHHRVFA